MRFPEDLKPYRLTRLDRLQIAFAVRTARLIAEADGMVSITEMELLALVFPDPILRRARLLDASGNLNDRAEKLYYDALSELPTDLSLEDKLRLVTLFHRTAMADGELHPTEKVVLLEAAQQLGIDDKALDDHLYGLRGRGTLVPPVRRS